jgi:MYXO-CTERM domain-containing protein
MFRKRKNGPFRSLTSLTDDESSERGPRPIPAFPVAGALGLALLGVRLIRRRRRRTTGN